MFGLNKPKGEEISDTWQASAQTLLNRILHKWSPSDKHSTESLCEGLKHFITSLGSAHERLEYPDGSRPPAVKVGAAAEHRSIPQAGFYFHQ